MKRVGVLISGRGTNLQALIDAQEAGILGGEIVIVISNKREAQGLIRAHSAGIKTEIVTSKQYPVREDHDTRVMNILTEYNVDLVVMAGYMRILSESFVSKFNNRIINVHPSLLPSFVGVHAQQQAIDYGVRFSGCTTHFVNSEVDAGPIILQSVVEVAPDDTAESLASRILPLEHDILVKSVRFFCRNQLKVEGRFVRIVGE